MQKKNLVYFLSFLAIFLFVFRSLIFNLSTHLFDWYDYPLIVWIVNQNISKISSLQFTNFFDTNAFYPNKNALLFTDTFLPQSIIALPFSFFTKNPILIFNFVFVFTFILNYLSSFLFWKTIFKKENLAFLGALLITFSPFFHSQTGHFQMQSYWPFFFALYFLFKNHQKLTLKNLTIIGVFLSIQFLAGVYLAVFLLFTLLLFFLIEFISSKKKFSIIKGLTTILLVFLIIDGVFIKGYLETKKMYNIKRDYGEFVFYAAHLSDYLFSNRIDSFIHNLKPIKIWNSFDKHTVGEKAAFPGFLITILSIFGLFSFVKKRGWKFSIGLEFNKERLFFFGLVLFGFLFSLGPRINFNGNYAFIPTPYTFLLKYLPFFETIRATARWSFLFYLGLIYFSLYFLEKISKNRKKFSLLFAAVLLVFALEYLPLKITAHAEEYINNDYEILREICTRKKKVLLEIPVTHLNTGNSIVEGLNYISKVMLASTYHNCYLINGYSGYDMPHLSILDGKVNAIIQEGDIDALIKLAKDSEADIIKINRSKLIKESRNPAEKIFQKIKLERSGFSVIGEEIFILK